MSKETYISFLVEQMKQGNVDAVKVCASFCSKFQKSERTFYNHWKNAELAYKEWLNAQQMIKDEIYQEEQKKAFKSAVLEREKVLEMTSNVLKLIYNKIVKGKEPSGTDIQAYNSTAERLSKMQGFDKPIQNEVALTDIVIKGQKFAKVKNDIR